MSSLWRRAACLVADQPKACRHRRPPLGGTWGFSKHTRGPARLGERRNILELNRFVAEVYLTLSVPRCFAHVRPGAPDMAAPGGIERCGREGERKGLFKITHSSRLRTLEEYVRLKSTHSSRSRTLQEPAFLSRMQRTYSKMAKLTTLSRICTLGKLGFLVRDKPMVFKRTHFPRVRTLEECALLKSLKDQRLAPGQFRNLKTNCTRHVD